MAKTERRIDILNGSLTKNIIVFTIPLILSALLQQVYHAADMVVLGQFSTVGDGIAAVGATGSLTNLLVNLFLGLAVGVNVVASRYYGKKDAKGMENITHTAVSVSIIGGVVIGVLGLLFAHPALKLMGTPDDVIDLSAVYMRIIFAGLPAQMLYNFGAAILRSVGETKKPMYILMISGLINVALNVFFVVVCGMNVDGVAYATIISQAFSAVMVMVYLIKIDDTCRFYFKKLRIRKREFFDTVRYGVPAGVQSSLFSVANIIIQAQINAHGTDTMNGNAASNNIESFLYSTMFQFSVAALTFTSQSVGAKRPDMIKRITRTCCTIVLALGVIGGAIFIFFGKPLCSIYLPDEPMGVELGSTRLVIIGLTYYILGVSDSLVGSIRGMGASFSSMAMSVGGICLSRIIWTYTVYPASGNSIIVLWLCYPMSWIITLVAQYLLYRHVRKKTENKLAQPSTVPA